MTQIAFAFDARGTLFDMSAAARRAADAHGRSGRPIAGQRPAEHGCRRQDDGRFKQAEYNLRQGLMGVPADFAAVTADAPDRTHEALNLACPALRARLRAPTDCPPHCPDRILADPMDLVDIPT